MGVFACTFSHIKRTRAPFTLYLSHLPLSLVAKKKSFPPQNALATPIREGSSPTSMI